MQERFADFIRVARKCARLTVERAAEMLYLSPRMLNYYEAGRWRVPDDIVERMVKLYGSAEIGYRWLSRELQTGRLILPANGFHGIEKAVPIGGRNGKMRKVPQDNMRLR